MFTALRHQQSSCFYKKKFNLIDIRAALFACRHVRIKESSTLPLDESFTSTSLQSHIYWTLLHDPHSFSSRQLTRCTSTGRLGTSYLAQRQTKTQPTSASTTPPRVKPRFIWSHLLSSFLRRLSILHHHLLLVFSRVMLLAVDLFNRPSCACRHMMYHPPLFLTQNLRTGRRLYSNMHFQNYFLKT